MDNEELTEQIASIFEKYSIPMLVISILLTSFLAIILTPLPSFNTELSSFAPETEADEAELRMSDSIGSSSHLIYVNVKPSGLESSDFIPNVLEMKAIHQLADDHKRIQEYSEENGNFRFEITMTRDWEIPYAQDHCFGASCELDPNNDEWLLFSPHNLDTGYFETTEETDQSHGGNWDVRLYISHYHAGLWIVDLETLIASEATDRIDIHFESTIGYYLPSGHLDGTPLDSAYYDFGWVPFLWAVEFHEGRIYASCISTGLYILQLDIDEIYLGTPV